MLLVEALVIILYISVPVLVVLVIIGFARRSRRSQEALEQILEGQKETNRLLRQHLTEENDSE